MIWTIAARELSTRGRSKGFIILTGIMFLGVVALALAVALLNGDDEAREVTIGVGGDGVDFTPALTAGDDQLTPTVIVVDDVELELSDGTIDVSFDGSSLSWDGAPDQQLDRYIRSAIQQATFFERSQNLGLSPDNLTDLFAEVEIAEVRTDGRDADDDGIRFITAGIAGLAMFMLLQVWGAFIMMGVIEEKSSKVVEVLLSHVRPSSLLAGKLIGLGILALVQMLIIVGGLALGLALTQDISIPSEVWATVPLLLITFLLGFAFYATAFAAVGSTVSRQEDAQSAQLPAMLPLLAGYMIASFSFSNPDNLVVKIGSFVPFTSPVLLLFRNALVGMPLWQIVLSLLILAGSSLVMLRLAGRIYQYSLLRSGSRVSFADAWRNRRADIVG